MLPDGTKNNDNIKLYADAMARLAGKHGVHLCRPVHSDAKPDARLERAVDDQRHAFECPRRRGSGQTDRRLAVRRRAGRSKIDLARLDREIDEKNLQFWHDYRAVNGFYIYGGRKKPFGVVNFPPEFAKLRKMIANRDARIWAVAKGKTCRKRSTTATRAISPRSRRTTRSRST